MDSSNPLTRLVVDAVDVREQLASALTDYVVYDERGQLAFTASFDRATARHRVLIAVMALIGQAHLGGREEGPVRPAEIQDVTGMPGGTVRPKLRELVDRRCLTSSDGAYILPDALVRNGMRELNQSEAAA